jgi:isoprenylcysteine carboxyl methyltransferase (ICMT) family protein YpbQ
MIWIEKTLDALALAYAILFFPAPFFWLIIHPAISFWRRFGNRSLWVAAPVWLIFGVTLVVLRGRIFSQRLGRNPLTAVLGFGLIALAYRIDKRVREQFTLRRLVGIPEMEPHRNVRGVVRDGIYARIRHPRYLVYMLSFWGLAFVTSALGFFVLAIVSVLMYLIVAPLEERELRQQYGSEYEAYCQAVPRFLPRLRRRV